MCQPGRPMPQGLSHDGSPGFDSFQRTKSPGYSLLSPGSMRAPASIESRSRAASLP